MVSFFASGSVVIDKAAGLDQVTVVHGGAGPEDPKDGDCGRAAAALARVLAGLDGPAPATSPEQSRLPREPALTMAEQRALQAAMLLENEPCFNAGYGAALQADGQVRLSAALMESTRRKFSAVINVRDIRHPSFLAAFLQRERFCVLDGGGAEALAWRLGIQRESLVVPHRFARWLALREASLQGEPQADGKGTIGCVSFASPGVMAALTSTGGVGNETVGRVGDTPTPAGNFCSQTTAVSCTGYGEQIVSQGFAVQLATRCDDGMRLHDAMQRGLEEAAARGFGLAAIALHWDASTGHVYWCAGSTESFFVWALQLPNGSRDFTDYLGPAQIFD